MKMQVYLKCLLGAVCLLALAACSGGGATATPAVQNTVLPPTGYPSQPTAVPVVTEGYPPSAGPTVGLPPGYPADAAPTQAAAGPDAIVALAKSNLAERLTVSVDQISLVSVEATDWPDASLGCPQPGQVYAQVVTPGYRVVLEQAQKQYEYHTGLKGQMVLCTP